MTTTNNDSYYINLLNSTTLYMYRYVLPVIYALSNLGNLLSAWIFWKKSWKKNVCVFYFKIGLLFNTCYVNTSILGSIFNNGYQISLQNSNILLCKMYFYLTFLFVALSPSILILASIDRLLISSQNIDTRLYSSKRLAYFSLTISTLFWIIYDLHILIKVSLQPIYSSVLICYYELSRSYQTFVSYNLTITNVVYCLAMIILCLFAFENVRHIRPVPREKRHQIRTMTKKDFQLLRCLFIQSVVYILFSTPITVYYLYDAITKNQLRTSLELATHSFLFHLFSFVYDILYSTNLFVFVIVSKSFRHEFKRTIYKIIGKEVVSMQEEENKQANDVGRDNVELNVVSAIEL